MIDVQALQAENLPPADWRNLFNFTKDGEPFEPDPFDVAMFDWYFRRFVGVQCPVCKVSPSFLTQMIGGPGAFTWGIAHGEGHCSECGYPARAYHRDVGPLEFVEIVLYYHPDSLRPKPTREEVNV